MAASKKISIEPDFSKLKNPVASASPEQTVTEVVETKPVVAEPQKTVVKKVTQMAPGTPATTSTLPTRKKIIKKIIRRKVVNPKTAVIKKSTATIDERNHDIKSDYLDRKVPLERSNLRLYVASILFMSIIVALAIGLFVAKSRVEEAQIALKESLEETQVEEPADLVVEEVVVEDETSTVEPIPVADITLEIRNGSGVAGAAGDVQEEFESLGYTVESISNEEATVGNQLYISSDYTEEELDNLMDDVNRRLGIEDVTGSLDDLETTARIILGSDN